MNCKLFPLVLVTYFFLFSCDKDSSLDNEEVTEFSENEVIDKEFTLKLSVNIYDDISSTWENSNAAIVIKGDNKEILKGELVSMVNEFALSTEYSTYNITVSKSGNKTAEYSFSKDQVTAYENSPLIVNLDTNVYEGDIVIESLEQYNDFVLGDYGRVSGDLIIAEIDNLTNIEELLSITSVGGRFSLIKVSKLTSLKGLNNLKSIGGGLNLYDNSSLKSLKGLTKLTSVGWIWIQENVGLSDLEGLNNVHTVNGRLEILSNENLIKLNGLNAINSIKGKVEIRNNFKLTSLEGLIGIVQIEDGLSVKGNLKLESLKGLDNIKSIVGDLVISECRVKSLEGLNAINSIIGTLSIYNNSFLFDWCALKNLFQNDGLNGGHFFANCSYNPKAEDIALGNCKP